MAGGWDIYKIKVAGTQWMISGCVVVAKNMTHERGQREVDGRCDVRAERQRGMRWETEEVVGDEVV